MCRCIIGELRLSEHATNWDVGCGLCYEHRDVGDERCERDGESRERNVESRQRNVHGEQANECAVAEFIGQWESDGGFCGTFYCENYDKHACGRLIAVAFSKRSGSHSVRTGGAIKGWPYTSNFTHSCPEHLRTQRTVRNVINGTELTLVTKSADSSGRGAESSGVHVPRYVHGV